MAAPLQPGLVELGAARIDDLPLFRAAPPPTPAAPGPSAVEARLSEVRPDDLSPREALELVYELAGLAAPAAN